MKQVYLSSRARWRAWLSQHHDREPDGIWLVFDKLAAGKLCLRYEEAVEEALCFGWIDSIIKRIDEAKYCRKFTPRKDNSCWSPTNKRRVAKLIKEQRMTPFGLAKITAAKRCGRWDREVAPPIVKEVPQELTEALARNRNAEQFFQKLPRTEQKHFIGWILTAKRAGTKERRLRECLALLSTGRRLGLK